MIIDFFCRSVRCSVREFPTSHYLLLVTRLNQELSIRVPVTDLFSELLHLSSQFAHKQHAAYLIISCAQLLSHRQQRQEIMELSFDSQKFLQLCEGELRHCLEQRVVKAQATIRRHLAGKRVEKLRESRRGLTRRREYLLVSGQEYGDILTTTAPLLDLSSAVPLPKKEFDLSSALAIEITSSPHSRQTPLPSETRSVSRSPRKPLKPPSGGNVRVKGTVFS
jgi:hypothetical protein